MSLLETEAYLHFLCIRKSEGVNPCFQHVYHLIVSLSLTMFGLVNIGNTCFLNAVLQALARCPPLVDALLKQPRLRDSKKAPLVPAFQQFFQDSQHATLLTPSGIVKTLLAVVADCEDDWYRPRQQADAAECIQYILDGLHDAMYRQVRITIHGDPETTEQKAQTKALESWSSFYAKEYSPIVEHFYGQYQIRITCDACKSVSERYEPWLMLKLPIPGGEKVGASVPSFADCMNAALAAEVIEGYACDTCKSPQTATMSTRISKLPNILLLTFKRFTNHGAKIRGQVDWDLEALSLKPWMAFRRCPFRDEAVKEDYKTFAILEHNGSARGGHYRMFAREGDSWAEADDESVRPVDVGTVISPDSYVIFAVPK
jgi:ubiquitin C-terminal hydrolase